MEMITPVRTEVANSINLIWHPHPISPLVGRTDTICAIRPGATVRDVLKASAIDPHQPIMVTLDDRLLTVDEWDTVCPAHHQILNVKATVQGGGGGGGSNVLQVVAMVAIVVVAAMLAAPTGGLSLQAAYGLTAAQAAGFAAAFAVAGSMLVNAVFAAQIPSTSMSSQTGQYSQGSPTYSLSGGQNRTRPYESMPVIMGVHRHIPDNAAKPFTEYHGEDQYLYQVFHLGLSTTDKSDWRIGTNPISNYTNWNWTYADSAGRINSFPGNVDSTPGAVLENSAGWIIRSTSPDTYRIGIDIEGTMYYANNGGGLDATSVQLRVQYKPSNSPTWIEPSQITTSGSGFVSGSYQPYYVKFYHFRRMFGGGYTETYEISKAEYDAAVSNQRNVYDEDGNLIGNSASNYEQRWRFVAGSGGTVIVSGASQAPRRASLFIDVPIGSYDVRVIRDTGDTTDARLQNKTNWSTLRSYQADRANYNGQSRIGLSIKASEQLNGTIQQLSYMAEAYASYWNGSAWTFEKTSNPAHWFMDFAIGRYDGSGKLTYGLGMPESQIDLAALNAWANFCAVEGLTFNAVLDDDRTAADMLTAIARCGFGSPTWASGKLGAVWDSRNATPVGAFGMSNIIKGSFEVNYITEQLAEEIIVRFTNPDKDWIQDEVRVTVPGIVNPIRASTVDLYGCTSARMAGKFANYLAAQQKYRKRRISWDADFEGLTVQRGDVVLLSHDLTQWGYSGRIVEQVGNTLTLDRTVPRNGSLDYLMIKRPDGTMTTYRVKEDSGDQHVIELTSTPNMLNGRLPMDHMWFFSPLATPGKKVKILSIQPVSESRVKIVATDEDPQFYDAWDGSWSEARKTTLLAPSNPVISGLQINERLSLIGTGQIVTRVTFSWQQQTSQLERVDLRYRINLGPWLTASVVSGQSFDVDFDGYGIVEVTALPIDGLFMGQAVTASAQVYGKTLPPQNVQAFTTDPSENRFTLRWNAVEDIDLAGYQIRWINGDSRDWGQAAPIHEGLIVSSPYISVVRPAGYGTLMIKAVDTSGNYSVTPAAIVLDLGDALVDNVILTVDVGAQGFPGTLKNCHVVTGNVMADEQGTMWNPNDAASMWHLESDAMWRAATYYPMTYNFTVDAPAHSAGSNLTLPATIAGDSWTIQYRRLGANKMWSGDPQPMWHSATDTIWTPPPPMSPWPGSVVAQEDRYEFQIDISFGANRGTISALAASFDVPDISETLPSVAIGIDGTRLPITKDYYEIKAVNLQLLAGTSAAFTAIVSDKDVAIGPLVKCFDISGGPISGVVDAVVQGY